MPLQAYYKPIFNQNDYCKPLKNPLSIKGNNSCMLLLGIPAKVKGFCVPVCKDCLIYLTTLGKKKSAVQPEKKRERE